MSESSSVCANHPQRPADDYCHFCGKHLCQDCVVEGFKSEVSFCSLRCRAQGARLAPRNEDLAKGMESPLEKGLVLWLKLLPTLLFNLAPLCLLAGLVIIAGGPIVRPEAGAQFYYRMLLEQTPWPVWLLLWILGAYGAALSAIVLSKSYTRFVHDEPYFLALRRLPYWLAAWLLMALAIGLGLVLLVVPGVYLAVRLAFGDQPALIFQTSPIDSLKRSWERSAGRLPLILLTLAVGVVLWAIVVALSLGLAWALMAFISFMGFGAPGFAAAVLMMGLTLGFAACHAPLMVLFYALLAEE